MPSPGGRPAPRRARRRARGARRRMTGSRREGYPRRGGERKQIVEGPARNRPEEGADQPARERGGHGGRVGHRASSRPAVRCRARPPCARAGRRTGPRVVLHGATGAASGKRRGTRATAGRGRPRARRSRVPPRPEEHVGLSCQGCWRCSGFQSLNCPAPTPVSGFSMKAWSDS